MASMVDLEQRAERLGLVLIEEPRWRLWSSARRYRLAVEEWGGDEDPFAGELLRRQVGDVLDLIEYAVQRPALP